MESWSGSTGEILFEAKGKVWCVDGIEKGICLKNSIHHIKAVGDHFLQIRVLFPEREELVHFRKLSMAFSSKTDSVNESFYNPFHFGNSL